MPTHRPRTDRGHEKSPGTINLFHLHAPYRLPKSHNTVSFNKKRLRLLSPSFLYRLSPKTSPYPLRAPLASCCGLIPPRPPIKCRPRLLRLKPRPPVSELQNFYTCLDKKHLLVEYIEMRKPFKQMVWEINYNVVYKE